MSVQKIVLASKFEYSLIAHFFFLAAGACLPRFTFHAAITFLYPDIPFFLTKYGMGARTSITFCSRFFLFLFVTSLIS
jgi:hypothetical protein